MLVLTGHGMKAEVTGINGGANSLGISEVQTQMLLL